MSFLKALFEFYVKSNLHVSVSVTCFVLTTGILFENEVNNEAFLLGCFTFVAYHFIRFFNRDKYGKTHLLEVFSKRNQWVISVLILTATTFSIYFITKIAVTQVLILIPFVIVTLLYGLSFITYKGERFSIRFLPAAKIFVIAFVWAGVVVLFPLGANFKTGIYFLEVFLFVIALTIPFDIRDVAFDDLKVKTLPMLLGVKQVKVLGGVLLLCSVLIHNYLFHTSTIQYLTTAFITMILIFCSKTKQSTYYASFWVEGIPILFYMLLSITVFK